MPAPKSQQWKIEIDGNNWEPKTLRGIGAIQGVTAMYALGHGQTIRYVHDYGSSFQLRPSIDWQRPARVGKYGKAPVMLIRRAQAIADAGFGQNIFRLFDIVLDLLAQLADIDAQILRVGEVVPQFAHQE